MDTKKKKKTETKYKKIPFMMEDINTLFPVSDPINKPKGT